MWTFLPAAQATGAGNDLHLLWATSHDETLVLQHLRFRLRQRAIDHNVKDWNDVSQQIQASAKPESDVEIMPAKYTRVFFHLGLKDIYQAAGKER